MSACNVPAFCRILIESTREDETCDSISHSLVNSGRTFLLVAGLRNRAFESSNLTFGPNLHGKNSLATSKIAILTREPIDPDITH